MEKDHEKGSKIMGITKLGKGNTCKTRRVP